MPKINVLPKSIADLIAAGEVVERPASVIKELSENAIDAGATAVTVEIQNGGITYMRITDNGCGICREDIRNAFKSHATSKIKAQEDLDSILTLGFRGEALASIAAVAKVEIMTRPPEEEFGTRYCIEAGEETLLDDAGCPAGTTVMVRDLFFCTPARMKFLKKDVTEANAVAGVLDRIALSHPEVSFRFIREGKQTLHTSGSGDLLVTAREVFGREFAEGMIPAEAEQDGIKVKGYVSVPHAARPNRNMQFFFINGRLIKTGTGSAAMTEAYKNSVMVGKFPSCILNLEMSPRGVDVNVHPAKTEVRFSNEKAVFNAVYFACKNALNADTSRVQYKHRQQQVDYFAPAPQKAEQVSFGRAGDFWQHFPVQDAEKPQSTAGADRGKEQPPATEKPVAKPAFSVTPLMPAGQGGATAQSKAEKTTGVVSAPEGENKPLTVFCAPEPSAGVGEEERPSLIPNRSFCTEEPNTVPSGQGTAPKNTSPAKTQADCSRRERQDNGTFAQSTPAACPTEPPELRVIGEVFKTYILAEVQGKLLVIDKHAAHERIIYEQLKAGNAERSAQILLSPVTVTLTKEEYAALLANTDILKKAGFEAEDFGDGMVIVRECPMEITPDEVADIIAELAGRFTEKRQDGEFEKMDWIFHSVACRSAIKAGDFTDFREMEQFTKRLLSMPDIRYCPHGRPVLIEMTQRELEKNFGRI